MSSDSCKVIDDFHCLYYDKGLKGGTWNDTYWLGIKLQKYPMDLWIYQEIIAKCKPDLIVETGTAYGGSALFLASICDLIGHGKVISIDVKNGNFPTHPRITYLTGNSVSEEVLSKIEWTDRNMVILDSDHRKDHVLSELRTYSKFVSVGQYLIVEDTNLNYNPVRAGAGPGPKEALDEFMNDEFVVDQSKHKYLISTNPNGYLLRVKPSTVQ